MINSYFLSSLPIIVVLTSSSAASVKAVIVEVTVDVVALTRSSRVIAEEIGDKTGSASAAVDFFNSLVMLEVAVGVNCVVK